MYRVWFLSTVKVIVHSHDLLASHSSCTVYVLYFMCSLFLTMFEIFFSVVCCIRNNYNHVWKLGFFDACIYLYSFGTTQVHVENTIIYLTIYMISIPCVLLEPVTLILYARSSNITVLLAEHWNCETTWMPICMLISRVLFFV